MDPDRQQAVASLLFDYVKSPSLRHLRDPHSIQKLMRDIVRALDRPSPMWSKWEVEREEITKLASPCWIPLDDLQTFLNTLPGHPLTKTDVEQRLRAIWEEPYTTYPKDELQRGCLDLYGVEKANGTEMRAIIGALREHLEREEERLREEQQERYRRWKENERVRVEQIFLSGADCGWTPIEKVNGLYCRRNGRTFRVEQGHDKRWALFRVQEVGDKGSLLGQYQGRRDASRALDKIAYSAEHFR
jgi:hypothetical protein